MTRRTGEGVFSFGVGRLAAALLVLASAAGDFQAGAQCTAVSGPTQIVDPSSLPIPYVWALGYSDHIVITENNQKLLVPVNYGFGIYSLANPASPQLLGWTNLITLLGAQCGDGQNYIARLGASDDGQRLLISVTSTMACRANTLVATPDGGNGYTLAGDFRPPQLIGGIGLQYAGGRRIAYGLNVSSNLVFAADVTSPPGFQLAPGSISPSVGNIPSGSEPRSNGAINDLVFADPYVVFVQGTEVTVLDARTPGAAPAPGPNNNPSITAGMPLWTVGVPSFGRAAGEQFLSVTAVKDPDPASLGKKVYILAAFQSATNQPTGFSLVRFDTTTGTRTLVGTLTPPPPYSGALAVPVASVALVPDSTGDVLAFLWTKRASTGLPDRGSLRLYTTTARSFGTNPGIAEINLQAYPNITSVSQTKIVRPTAIDAYAYLATTSNAYVMKLNCTPPIAPATSGLRVFDGGTELPGDGTATAFIGDTLTVQPSVAPGNAFLPISSWNVDWDDHAASEDDGSEYPRLRFPDSSAAGDPGGPWTYVGPCDPKAGGVVSTGAGCWNSVVTNGGYGGPDFSPNPAAGTTKALSFALEACNSFTPCSNGPAVFTINWKVPAVRLKSSSILTGMPVQDGSDGHPSATGYKWYFGANPTSPLGETMTLDSNCSGPSCPHGFAAGNGTYNVWMTVPYATGYTTPDCASPCVSRLTNQLTLKVTDLVPAFLINGSTTAPTTTYQSTAWLAVADNSQRAAGVTVAGYGYCFSPSGGTPPCSPVQPFTPGQHAIPLPAAGSYWLYIRTTYTGGTQTSADWTPAVSGLSDPKAWPVIVKSQPPSVRLTNVSSCGGFCDDVYAYVGDTITATAWVGGGADPNPPSGLSWVVSPSGAVNVSTGAGQNFSFTITAQSDFILTMNGYGLPVARSITVLVRNPLRVSVNANPMSAMAGTPMSFSATATGGSGSYTSYSWNFGDGTFGTGQSVSHSYVTPGSYSATSTATDSLGATANASVIVSVTANPAGFYTLPPCRLFDTRNVVGPDAASPSLSATEARIFIVAGRCGVPAAAKALSLNVTVTAPTVPGFLSLYPGDTAAPVASTINFGAGRTRANNGVFRLSTDGSQTLGARNGSAGSVHFILDVNGYFR